jgi:transposase
MELDLPSTKNKEKPKAQKAIKLRVYPTHEQEEILKAWFGCSRWIYNTALYALKTNQCKFNRKHLRERFVHDKNYQTENKWMLDIPYDVRDEALQDLINNYKSNFGKGGKFNVKFRKRKEHNSISILSKHWNRKLGKFALAYKDFGYEGKLIRPSDLNYTSRLIRTQLNEYYLCIPKPLEMSESQVHKEVKVLSIDPGVRTLMTGYDLDGQIIEFGKNDIGLLARLLHYKNKLQSKMSKASHRQRRIFTSSKKNRKPCI